MIYRTREEIYRIYGNPFGGLRKGRFNAAKRSSHSDEAYKYEFGYHNGHCLYAIIQKDTGKTISLEEAEGFRISTGKGEWKLNVALDPAKNTVELQALLDDQSRDLGYFYTPTSDDRSQTKLICVHQRGRKQLVIYHPGWRPDLSKIEADPL